MAIWKHTFKDTAMSVACSAASNDTGKGRRSVMLACTVIYSWIFAMRAPQFGWNSTGLHVKLLSCTHLRKLLSQTHLRKLLLLFPFFFLFFLSFLQPVNSRGKIKGDGWKFLDRFKSYSGSQISLQSVNEVHIYRTQPKSATKVSFSLQFCLWLFRAGARCPLTFDLVSL